MQNRQPSNVKRVETWTVSRGRTEAVQVSKVAVRVPKGHPSGRGGQFHGATNFPER